MILLIDNYDSFSYNLYQLIGSLEPDIRVVRNDAMTVEEIRALSPQAVILSPGPGRPEDAGVCIDVVRALADVPILGVCLGHQAICTAFGATVSYAKKLMHGKQSLIGFDADCPLFRGCPRAMLAARYHSLAALEETLPRCLKVTARADTPISGNGEIMAVRHLERPVFGLQFHPESVMTPDGKVILKNFIDLSRERRHIQN
ncbi:MAG: aminodeoxychorismate/anthranilate synthase component II [Fretibacterium sp.]|nr:aminodeoxychorismate/anthranilate synthase component II [Fretibacterium sp.]